MAVGGGQAGAAGDGLARGGSASAASGGAAAGVGTARGGYAAVTTGGDGRGRRRAGAGRPPQVKNRWEAPGSAAAHCWRRTAASLETGRRGGVHKSAYPAQAVARCLPPRVSSSATTNRRLRASLPRPSNDERLLGWR